MQLFLDTFDKDLIQHYAALGLIDGVTTNPSLVAKSGGNYIKGLEDICKVVKDNVSAQVTGETEEVMLEQAEKLIAISTKIVIKVPLTELGLKVCHKLSSQGVRVNVTLCFSPAQALLAAKAGAAYVSPFIGRLDDCGENGIELIRNISAIYKNYPHIKTQILAASIRNIEHVVESAKAGAHVATVPATLVKQMFFHPLTDKGMEIFHADWKNTGHTANW